MLQQPSAKSTKKPIGENLKPSRVRNPGICAAAKALGVNRVTLWRAIHGKWELPRLMARYEALKSKEAN
jgi:hypothetical protein